jgi:hypothetical protein
MDIKEIRSMQAVLNGKILNLIKEFEQSTDCAISRLELGKSRNFEDIHAMTIDVHTEIKL